MEFIINMDDSSFRFSLLTLCFGNQNERLTFLRLFPIDLAHPNAKQQMMEANLL